LKIEIETNERQPKNIEILDLAVQPLPVRSFGVAHIARVLVRRGLSEFRDGTLSRHKGLMKVAKRVAKALKATGEA